VVHKQESSRSAPRVDLARRRCGGGTVLLLGHVRGSGQRHRHRPPFRRPGRRQGEVRTPPAGVVPARRRTTCADVDSTSRSGCCAVVPLPPLRQELAERCSVSGRGRWVSIDQGAIPLLAPEQTLRRTPGCSTRSVRRFARPSVKPSPVTVPTPRRLSQLQRAGVIYTDLAMIAGVATTCEVCEERRFEGFGADHHPSRPDISEVSGDVGDRGLRVLRRREAHTRPPCLLGPARRRRLCYLTLGSRLPTLSGGDGSASSLATHRALRAVVLPRRNRPAACPADGRSFSRLSPARRLRQVGVVIDHHQAVMADADWIIDLAPAAATTSAESSFEGIPRRPRRRPFFPPSPSSPGGLRPAPEEALASEGRLCGTPPDQDFRLSKQLCRCRDRTRPHRPTSIWSAP